MTDSQLILATITSGVQDDATTAAALDAIREESGGTLLSAVLEVARAWHAGRNARDLAEANTYLAADSTLREALVQATALECHNVTEGAHITLVVEEGDRRPEAIDTSLFADGVWMGMYHVRVGALWIKRVANRLMIEQEQPPKAVRRRRPSK